MQYCCDQIRAPIVLSRGGTSKVFFWRDDLPAHDHDEIEQWIQAIHGSPERCQIDGVGELPLLAVPVNQSAVS
ncbi:MAG: 3-methylitaconate isomerase [Bradyrhizobium sp.]|nr:3-methylitaconate isomerase [Bradyrhizobium sp.]